MEDVGFSVIDEVELGDLSEVKEDRQVLPVAGGVVFTISDVKPRQLPDDKAAEWGQLKSLSLQLKLTDGLEVPDTNGSGQIIGTKMAYKGKVLFLDLPYFADTSHPKRQAEKYVGKNRSFLNPLKTFLVALGYDPKAMPKVNDELISALKGRQVKADIKVTSIRVQEGGVWKDTGETKNLVTNFKAV